MALALLAATATVASTRTHASTYAERSFGPFQCTVGPLDGCPVHGGGAVRSKRIGSGRTSFTRPHISHPSSPIRSCFRNHLGSLSTELRCSGSQQNHRGNHESGDRSRRLQECSRAEPRTRWRVEGAGLARPNRSRSEPKRDGRRFRKLKGRCRLVFQAVTKTVIRHRDRRYGVSARGSLTLPALSLARATSIGCARSDRHRAAPWCGSLTCSRFRRPAFHVSPQVRRGA